MFKLDPAHAAMDLFDQEIAKAVWSDKYRFGNEERPVESFARVCDGVYAKDSTEHRDKALMAMVAGLWVPAGRIQAGAGTTKRVTQINCYVMRTLPDDLRGIGETLTESMLTMQQGGGIGLDFSPLRPKGAMLRTTGEGATASGPVSYMNTWNSMCQTIMSAGSRRGAMMAVLDVSHPDIEEFIEAKHEAGRLTNFNISVLISDAFMEAVQKDEDWVLEHEQPDFSSPTIIEDNSEFLGLVKDKCFWRRVRARELWDKITHSTYEYSEPGVIFIDQITRKNNLWYCEDIRATNPCGEQPLPPHGACCLGATNLARMVEKPFTDNAQFDFRLLAEIAEIGTRFLDNVIETTHYPLPEQEKEAFAKRRIGLGITGLANAMAELGMTYGSDESIQFTRSVMETICNSAYKESIELSKQRGSFLKFNREEHMQGYFIETLNKDRQRDIENHGIRNGVLLTIAPTGTTSLYYGNVSSGLEPVFSYNFTRWMLQPNGERREYEVEDYGHKLFRSLYPEEEIPSYMVKASDLSVSDHLAIQSACQSFVDASISKTINCPEEISFEEFQQVYTQAYDLGCKGCTTYRPSKTRGAVLSEASVEEVDLDLDDVDFDDTSGVFPEIATPRPSTLSGRTYKVKWPTIPQAFYITINNIGNPPRPFEIFISSKSAKYAEWTTGLSLMISAIFRKGGDISFIPEELKQVVSAHEAGWIGGEFVGSMVAQIGKIIESHLDGIDESARAYVVETLEDPEETREIPQTTAADFCPQCGQPALLHKEGCSECQSCDFTSCG